MSQATQTQHVPIGEIARFATALRVESREFEAIRRHLAEGCDMCAERLAACRQARNSKAIPPLVMSDWILPRRVVRPVDKRSGSLADHQLVCGAGNYELDVIVRELEVPQRLDIGGQVTQAAALHDPARDVPLYLLEARGRNVLSTTRTDEFGEFDFSATTGSRYGLRVGEGADAPCVLVWDGSL